jgi:SNF2 family DNA or RNA helicase
MKNYFFAIGYIPHRLWGNILIAQLLERDEQSLYFVSGEVLLKNEQSLSYSRLTNIQKEVVNIIDRYNDKNLHRMFSKKRTVKEFHDTVDKGTIDQFIRPYIEKQMYQVLELASENHFSVFIKEKATQNIFTEDFLVIHHRPARPLFHFNRTNEGTIYRLSIFYNDQPVSLLRDTAEVICNQPAIVRLDNHLYFVEAIEAKKMGPFFEKEQIIVPPASEKKYYSTFVAGILREHETIDARGFNVEETIPRKEALLTLEFGLNQQPVWVLRVRYNEHTFHPSSQQQRFVAFTATDGTFTFKRFRRDEAWEDRLDIALEEIGLSTRDRNVYTLSKDSYEGNENNVFEAINFTCDHHSFLIENGFILGQKLDRKYHLGTVELNVRSEEKEDWFDLHAVVQFGSIEVPFLSLREHILTDQRVFMLPDGTGAVLPAEWFTRYRAMFEFGKVEKGRLRIHKQHFSQVDEAMRREHKGTIARLEKLVSPEQLPRVDMPAALNADLRNYQIEGISWLLFLRENGFGGCLADDMGLGKTLQAIAILQQSKEKSDASSGKRLVSLVIVPASLVHNWSNEIGRFAPDLRIHLHVGSQRERNAEAFPEHDIILSSYHTVRQDIDFFSEFPFHYVILDESQMIKNPASKLYRSMEQLQAAHRLVLTGTPIENSLTDLWSQINFVNRGLLGSLSFFRRQFVLPIEKKKDPLKEERLKELITPFILRRTKEDVARELPPVYEQTRYCNMTTEQKRMYEAERSSARNSILERLEEISLEQSAVIVLQALTRLRQISNHPVLADEAYPDGSGKFDEVFRDIESVVAEDHKVLVFSSFVKHLDLYAERLKEMGWKYAYLTGKTIKREEQVTYFQEDPDCRIFLISLKAGGVGLNLTAADYVFILDPWWNPAAEMQALNRAHRIGQDKNVFVYRFISNDTVEEKIRRLQERKAELAKTFVTTSNPLKDMKREEIMELFS